MLVPPMCKYIMPVLTGPDHCVSHSLGGEVVVVASSQQQWHSSKMMAQYSMKRTIATEKNFHYNI